MSPTDPYPMKTLGSPDLNGNNGHAPAPVPPPLPAETPAPPALSAPPSLEAVWHILRRRWPIVVGAGLLAALLGAAVAWFVTPGKYATYVVIHLESRNPKTGSIEPDELLSFQRTQIATLKSYEVISRLIAKPEIRELSEMQKHQGSEQEWLQKDLEVDTKLGTELLRVTLTGDNPDDLAMILNALVVLYKEKADADELAKINGQIELLQSGLKDTDKETKTGAPVLDGPGRDLRALEWKQQDWQQKITALQFQLGQLQAQIRKDEIDKADFERKRTKPNDLVKEFDLLERLDQDDQIRPLRIERILLAREMQEGIRLAPSAAVREERSEQGRRKLAAKDKKSARKSRTTFARPCKKRKCRS